MNKNAFTDEELEEMIPAARAAGELDTNPWDQLAAFFKARREAAESQIEARPTVEPK